MLYIVTRRPTGSTLAAADAPPAAAAELGANA